MHRLLMVATAVAALLALLSGCSGQTTAPITADEAARQTEITRQGALNAPTTNTNVGGSAPAAPSH